MMEIIMENGKEGYMCYPNRFLFQDETDIYIVWAKVNQFTFNNYF